MTELEQGALEWEKARLAFIKSDAWAVYKKACDKYNKLLDDFEEEDD